MGNISPKRKEIRRHPKAGNEYMQLGIQIGTSFLAFIGLGYWLDGMWHTKPLFLLIGAAFAMLSMVALLYKVWKQLDAKAEKKTKDQVS
ncbi:MAG: AtpZ/AtpI family protein [Bacteroidetes Order II. Incertae sedis bacterium]|nr:AtpZ/AtpI family protein [Bacteroidetes Order II. bacterium]